MKEKAEKIFTAQDHMQAQMIIQALKAQKIPAYRRDLENAGLLNIYGGNSRSGEEIYVAPQHVDAAMEVLYGMGLAE